MKNDKSLPLIPDRECRSGISTPVEYHSFGTPKRPLSRIRAWRSADVEEQARRTQVEQAEQIKELDTFWKLRMRNRP
jgi:hypothetical protein